MFHIFLFNTTSPHLQLSPLFLFLSPPPPYAPANLVLSESLYQLKSIYLPTPFLFLHSSLPPISSFLLKDIYILHAVLSHLASLICCPHFVTTDLFASHRFHLLPVRLNLYFPIPPPSRARFSSLNLIKLWVTSSLEFQRCIRFRDLYNWISNFQDVLPTEVMNISDLYLGTALLGVWYFVYEKISSLEKDKPWRRM